MVCSLSALVLSETTCHSFERNAFSDSKTSDMTSCCKFTRYCLLKYLEECSNRRLMYLLCFVRKYVCFLQLFSLKIRKAPFSILNVHSNASAHQQQKFKSLIEKLERTREAIRTKPNSTFSFWNIWRQLCGFLDVSNKVLRYWSIMLVLI